MSRLDVLLLPTACLLIAACGSKSAPGVPGTGGAGGAAVVAPPLLAVVSDRFPAADATGICSDAQLRLTFTVPVKVGTAGRIQIWKSSAPDTAVDTVDIGAATFKDTIGGRSFNQNRPVFIDGMQAIIYLHRAAMLTANETYFVTVESGVFVDFTGASLGEITAPTDWAFTTRAPTPASPDNLVVALDNTGDFCSVQSAVDFIPSANNTPVTINVMNGTYREIVFILLKHKITVRGQDRKLTRIAYANNNTLQAPAATAVRALFGAESVNDLTIENITIHNLTPQGGSQAEALRVDPANRIILRGADFISLQDTLLLSGSVYATDCYVEGNVDFIWGTGTAYFDKCEIKTVGRKGYNVQSRTPAGRYGYVFVDSKLTADPGLTGHVLARIDSNSFPASHVAYINCEMGSHIDPAGWLITGLTDTTQIRFWEYGSVDPTGAPIDVSTRHAASRQLGEAEAAMMRDTATVFAVAAWNPKP